MTALTTTIVRGPGPAAAPVPRTPEQLACMDGFRAVAIVEVATAHVYGLALDGASPDAGTTMALTFFRGATALFVFISGYVFQFVEVPRLAYGTYLTGKWKLLGTRSKWLVGA